MNTAIIAVDPQWDHYSTKGALGFEGCDRALTALSKLWPEDNPDTVLLIASRELNEPQDGRISCIKRTKGSALHPQFAKADYIITKHGVSAFEGGTLRPLMGLEEILADEGIEAIHIGGYYLEDTVAQTAFDANALGYKTFVNLDACCMRKPAAPTDIVSRLERAGVACYRG